MSENLVRLNGRETAMEREEEPRAQTELDAIAAAYAEVSRRDTALERRLYHSHVREVALLITVLLLGIVLAWVFAARSEVQAFVQVVQVDEAGKVHLLGQPQELLQYTPPEGIWLDMLGEWVRKVRWRGVDEQLARQEWRWAYRHSCKDARAVLQYVEETEKPFSMGRRLVAVQLKSVTKSDVPRAYTVLWDEIVTEGLRQPVVQHWTGTFSIGRTGAPTLETALYNRLGLCVTAFDISQQP
jgi:type IV secretory pathway TrbF-like protein